MGWPTDRSHDVIARLKAQRGATLVQVGAVAGAAVCIGLAALLQAPINQQRKELQLLMQSDIYRALPPKYAWISATGGVFRGVAVDLLWMRAENLKQEGKYFEAHQLAKWICTLQPRFPMVWTFQAWNMAYNISVATHTPQERWQWVYNGIRLLRDEGIPNNERVVPLYHELGWIWFHKVGDSSDDMHHYYKRIWAATMETLLGPPPTGVSTAETIDWFRPIAEAPRTLEALIKAHPGIEELLEQLEEAGVDVKAETNLQRIFHPLEEAFFRPYTAYRTARDLEALQADPSEPSDQAPDKLARFFARTPPAKLDPLLAYLRAKVLREQYKMDPQFMLEITGRLGTDAPIPIDWRTPWSQAIYWSMYGNDRGGEATNVEAFDVLKSDRLQVFSLQKLALGGRLLFRINQDDPMKSYLALMPDFRYTEAMHRKYLELGVKHKEEGEDVENRTAEIVRSGHVNFLHETIVNLYMAGRQDEARRYLEYLAQYYPHHHTGQRKELYLQGLYPFVRSQLRELATGKSALPLIHFMLARGYMNLANGEGQEYGQAVQEAGKIYRLYQKDFIDSSEGRQSLMPFAQLQTGALVDFIANRNIPVVLRSAVWQRVPDEVRRWTYRVPDFAAFLDGECKRLELDPQRAFPKPPGLEAWLKSHPVLLQEEDVAKEYKEKRRDSGG